MEEKLKMIELAKGLTIYREPDGTGIQIFSDGKNGEDELISADIMQGEVTYFFGLRRLNIEFLDRLRSLCELLIKE